MPSDLRSVPEIRKALKLAEESAYTPSELLAYEDYWNAVSTEKTLWMGHYRKGLSEGETKGIAKGKAEEQKESIQEIAKNMLRKKSRIILFSTPRAFP